MIKVSFLIRLVVFLAGGRVSMKINFKFEKYLILEGCRNLSSKAKYQLSKKDDGRSRNQTNVEDR